MVELGQTLGKSRQEDQKTQDEIGPDDTIFPVFKVLRDRVNIRDLSTIVKTRDTSTDTIYGLATYGTDDYDATYDNSQVVVRVVNPNNEFIERFRFGTFENTTITDADWNTTTNLLGFTAGQTAQTTEIFLNNENLISAKPKITLDSGSTEIFLSRDAGISWGKFTNNIESNFAEVYYDIESFNVVGDWENGFDGDGTESIATISSRKGLKCTTNLAGDAVETLEDCSATGRFSTVDSVSFHVNSTTYKEGASAMDITKSNSYETGHWKCNDDAANTTVVDATGNNDGTAANNTSTMSEVGKINDGLAFNGSSDAVTIGDVLPLTSGDYSVCCWIKMSNKDFGAGAPYQNIINKEQWDNAGSNAGYGFVIDADDDKVNWLVFNNGDHQTYGTSLSDSTWTHICAVFDSSASTLKFYQNGTLTNTSTSVPSPKATDANDQLTFGAGSQNGGLGDKWKGTLDDVRFYDRELDQEEIDSIYLSGTGTENALGGSSCGFDITFDSAQNMDSTSKRFCWYLYIKDQTTLDKIASIKMYLSDGSGWNVWTTAGSQIGTLTTGWNYFRLRPNLPEDVESGGADETALTKVRFRIYTNNNTDLWTDGDVILDYVQERTQSGYGSALNGSYSGNWTGHSTSDKIGFYFYCPDSTKFGTLQFSFGDTVSGGTQHKAFYQWTVSGGDIVNGWNYLSATLSEFTLDGYTIDFSDIAQLRFTTNYGGSIIDDSPYEPDDTQDYYFSDLAFESQSGTPAVTNDLRLKLIEDGASTASISEMGVEYTHV